MRASPPSVHVRGEGRHEQVASLLDRRDVALSHVESLGELHLSQPERVTQRGEAHRVLTICIRECFASRGKP